MKFFRQFANRNCGQIAVAAITGNTPAEVETLIGHSHGTKTKELKAALQKLGWQTEAKVRPWFHLAQVPELALAQLRSERHSGWHWIAVCRGVVYDGHNLGPVDFTDYTSGKALSRQFVKSYLVVTLPRPGAVRHKHKDEYIVTNPGEPLYSTAIMSAEDVFTETGWENYAG